MATDVEIIARLGRTCRLPWAHGVTTAPDGHTSRRTSSDPFWLPLPPTLAEWQAEWAREHPGEPGPVSSWRSKDGRVEWSVDRYLSVEVRVAGYIGYRYVRENGSVHVEMHGDGPMADAAECVRLMQVVEGPGVL